MSKRSVRLADVCKVVAGGTPRRGVAQFYGGTIPWVKTLDLNCGSVLETQEHLTEEGVQSIRGSLNPPGTVCVAMYGGAGTIGKSGILRIAAVTNQAVACVLPNPDRFDSDFLHYQLVHLRREWMQYSQGNRKDPNINKGVVERMPIWLPTTVEEQTKIAARLDLTLAEAQTAKTAIDVQTGDIAALSAAIYRKAFRHVVPVSVPTALSQAPGGWNWHKLNELAQLESGHTPSRSRADWWGGDISWVSLTEIRSLDGKWVDATNITTNEKGIANSSARLLPRGTVCFSRTASVGFVTILGRPMATSQDFANWICGEELEVEYLMYALMASREQLRAIATGATHKTIYMPELSSLMICAPSRTEQKKLVSELRASLGCVEDLRSALKQLRSEVLELPRQILAQAFGQ